MKIKYYWLLWIYDHYPQCSCSTDKDLNSVWESEEILNKFIIENDLKKEDYKIQKVKLNTYYEV